MTTPDSTKKQLVFLSHANEDKPAVRKLAKRLRKDGFDPWLDEEKLIPGQNWELEIEKAIRASDAILLCCSAQSIAKEGFIQKEYKRAMYYQESKPEGVIFVIPVRLGECELPFFLHDLHWVDFPANYHRLLLALNTRVSKLPPVSRSTNDSSKIHSLGKPHQKTQGKKERTLVMKTGKFLLTLLFAAIAGLMSDVVATYIVPTFENRHWLAILIFIVCVIAGAIISFQDKDSKGLNIQTEQTESQMDTNNISQDTLVASVQQKSKAQRKKGKIDTDLIKNLIQHDQIEKAVSVLIQKGCENAVILDQRLSRLKRQELLGTIRREDVNAERATIALSVIEIVNSGEC